jgi:AmmeMemoRadiSam system protein A
LLARARNAIARRLGHLLLEEPHHPALQLPGATFVTLHHEGRLRGCIGRLEAGNHPLEMDVRQNAIRAAFEDPRFNPVSAQDWPCLDLEVSLLESPRALEFESEPHALAQLNPGLDGVIFTWRHYRSTFLPQVWEQLPKIEDFMAALKRKAGLAETFWAEDVQLACYRVRVFREIEPADAAMNRALYRLETT